MMMIMNYLISRWYVGVIGYQEKVTQNTAKEVHFGTTAEEISRRALGDDANIIYV